MGQWLARLNVLCFCSSSWKTVILSDLTFALLKTITLKHELVFVFGVSHKKRFKQSHCLKGTQLTVETKCCTNNQISYYTITKCLCFWWLWLQKLDIGTFYELLFLSVNSSINITIKSCILKCFIIIFNT
jgi:hypothetical protein